MKIDITEPPFIDKEKFKALYSDTKNKYYVTIVPTYNIAECALYDAWQLAKDNKTKGVWRMLLREAYKAIKTNGVDMIAQRELLAGYELLLDVGDRLQERLARELQFIKVAISNIVINATSRDCELKKRIIFACWTYEWCTQLHDGYFRGLKEKNGIDFSINFAYLRQTYVYEKLRKACEYFCEDCLDALESNRKKIAACETAIINKWSSDDFINDTIRAAMVVNGNYNDIIAQADAETEKEERESLGIDRLKEKYKVK